MLHLASIVTKHVPIDRLLHTFFIRVDLKLPIKVAELHAELSSALLKTWLDDLASLFNNLIYVPAIVRMLHFLFVFVDFVIVHLHLWYIFCALLVLVSFINERFFSSVHI